MFQIRIRIQPGQWIRIRIQKGKMPTKIKRSSEILCFELLDVLFLRAEGFSSILGVLYGSLRISKLHFLIKKFQIIFCSCKVLFCFVHQNPGSGLVFSLKILLAPVSGINESRSETLLCTVRIEFRSVFLTIKGVFLQIIFFPTASIALTLPRI